MKNTAEPAIVPVVVLNYAATLVVSPNAPRASSCVEANALMSRPLWLIVANATAPVAQDWSVSLENVPPNVPQDAYAVVSVALIHRLPALIAENATTPAKAVKPASKACVDVGKSNCCAVEPASIRKLRRHIAENATTPVVPASNVSLLPV